MKYLLQLDYFATPYELKIYHKNKLSSYLGLILTSITFAIGVAITITQGSDLYKRKKPKVNRNIEFVDKPLSTNLINNEFHFTYRFDGDFVKFLDKSFFNFQILNYLKISTYDSNGLAKNVITRIPLEYELCKENKDHWNRYTKFLPSETNLTDLYNILEFNKHICLKNYNVSIGGNYNSDYFSNVYIEVSRCVNSTTSSIVCKSPNEINGVFTGNNFQLFYINTVVDSNIFEKPLFSYIDSYWVKLDQSIYYSNDIYLSRQSLMSDNGFIFEEIKSTNSWYFERFREIINISTSGRFLRLYLNVGKNEIIERRYYMKAQELAALVGGFIKILIIFGHTISYFFNDYKFDIMLINHLFSEEIKENNGTTVLTRKTKDLSKLSNKKKSVMSIANFENLKNNIDESANINENNLKDVNIGRANSNNSEQRNKVRSGNLNNNIYISNKSSISVINDNSFDNKNVNDNNISIDKSNHRDLQKNESSSKIVLHENKLFPIFENIEKLKNNNDNENTKKGILNENIKIKGKLLINRKNNQEY